MNANRDFEIGLCWGTLLNASLVELIEAAARHHFTTLSVRPDSVLDLIASGTSEAALRKRLRDAGVRVRVIDALGGGLPGMPHRVVASDGKSTGPADEDMCFRAAEAVACPMVNVTLYGGAPATLDAIAETLKGAAQRAAARGLGMVLEFVPGTSMPDIHAAHTIVKQCGEPNCAILLDPWHLARSDGTLDDVLALPPGMLGAFQLDDRTPPAPGAPYVPMSGRDLPGEGQLPLHALARAALANNPNLTAEVEVFSDELRALPIDAAAARVARAIAAWRVNL